MEDVLIRASAAVAGSDAPMASDVADCKNLRRVFTGAVSAVYVNVHGEQLSPSSATLSNKKKQFFEARRTTKRVRDCAARRVEVCDLGTTPDWISSLCGDSV